MQGHYNITCSSFIPTKYNYFSTLPQTVDGYVQIWHEFKNSIALEIRTLHLHLPFPLLHYSGTAASQVLLDFKKSAPTLMMSSCPSLMCLAHQ
jgi:hypothetical protein